MGTAPNYSTLYSQFSGGLNDYDAEKKRILAQPTGWGAEGIAAAQQNATNAAQQMSGIRDKQAMAHAAQTGVGGGALMNQQMLGQNQTQAELLKAFNDISMGNAQAEQQGREAQNTAVGNLMGEKNRTLMSLFSAGEQARQADAAMANSKEQASLDRTHSAFLEQQARTDQKQRDFMARINSGNSGGSSSSSSPATDGRAEFLKAFGPAQPQMTPAQRSWQETLDNTARINAGRDVESQRQFQAGEAQKQRDAEMAMLQAQLRAKGSQGSTASQANEALIRAQIDKLKSGTFAMPGSSLADFNFNNAWQRGS